VRLREERRLLLPQRVLAFEHVPSRAVMELRRAHRLAELRLSHHLAEEGVGREEDVVVEEDVEDAHDPLFAQHHVVHVRASLVHREPDAEMRVVVEIRTRGDDPVHEAVLEERDQARPAQASRSERATQREADRDVRLQHLLDQEPASLAEPRGVVSEERAVHELVDGDAGHDRIRRDLRTLGDSSFRRGHQALP
jgi:hypothetical protein